MGSLAPILEAMQLLGKNQREIAELMGVTPRTVQRWQSGEGSPISMHFAALARALQPAHPEAAARMAALARSSLDSLLAMGLAAPLASQPPVAAHAPAVPVRLDQLDSVIGAAAEAVDLTPRAVRRVFAAAFARARALGLPIEPLVAALSAIPADPKK